LEKGSNTTRYRVNISKLVRGAMSSLAQSAGDEDIECSIRKLDMGKVPSLCIFEYACYSCKKQRHSQLLHWGWTLREPCSDGSFEDRCVRRFMMSTVHRKELKTLTAPSIRSSREAGQISQSCNNGIRMACSERQERFVVSVCLTVTVPAPISGVVSKLVCLFGKVQ
jgi:hypothetical protein